MEKRFVIVGAQPEHYKIDPVMIIPYNINKYYSLMNNPNPNEATQP